MIKNLTIVLLLAFGLTGCSAKKEIRYLTQEEAQQYPVIMSSVLLPANIRLY